MKSRRSLLSPDIEFRLCVKYSSITASTISSFHSFMFSFFQVLIELCLYLGTQGKRRAGAEGEGAKREAG